MINFEDESKRLQVMNQRFAFLMNGIMLCKTRQAGGANDLALDILIKKIETELTDMIQTELSTVYPKPVIPTTLTVH